MGTARRYPGQDLYTPQGYIRLVINAAGILVVVAAVVAIAALGWYFFAPRRASCRAGPPRLSATHHRDGEGRLRTGRDPGAARCPRWRSRSTGGSRGSAPTGWSSRSSGRSMRRCRRTRVPPCVSTPTAPVAFGFPCGMNMVHGPPARRTGRRGHHRTRRPRRSRGTATARQAGGQRRADGPDRTDRTRRQPISRRSRGGRDLAERRAEIADRAAGSVVGAVLTATGAVRGDGDDVFGAGGSGAAAQPLAPAGPDHAGDAVRRLAHPSHRLARAGAPCRRDELADHAGHLLPRTPTASSAPSRPACCPADLREVYFEAVGVIITLVLCGRLLEARAKAGTGEAIRLVGPAGPYRTGHPGRRRDGDPH